MTDYSVLSDISINAMVSRKLYGEPLHEHRLELVNQVVDYCNKPDDAMPIIIENKISIAFDTNENEWLAWGDFEFDQCGWDMINEPTIYCSHANPLRAAMIVFLQMQENNHD